MGDFFTAPDGGVWQEAVTNDGLLTTTKITPGQPIPGSGSGQFLELGILAAMKADSALSALVGSIFIGTLAANHCIPAVLIRSVATKFIVDADETEQLRYSRVQFDCIDMTYVKSLQIAAAIKNLFIDYVGALPNGLSVQATIPQMEMDSPVEEPGRGGQPLNRRILDLEFWFVQT